jgi:hypothetical protein
MLLNAARACEDRSALELARKGLAPLAKFRGMSLEEFFVSLQSELRTSRDWPHFEEVIRKNRERACGEDLRRQMEKLRAKL